MISKRKSRSKFAQVRHAFLYDVIYGDGTRKKKKSWAKVIRAIKRVLLKLTEKHVQRAIELHGAGKTSTCAMALCAYAHKAAFPHPVEGHIDWNYSRAWVASKNDKQGLPNECYCYEHNDKGIAKLNDTLEGHKKLLKMIQENGPITVVLKPYRKRSEEGRPGRSRKSTGKRDPIKQLKGAKLRYATFQLGATPAVDAKLQRVLD